MTQSKQIGLATCTCAHISPSNENILQMGSIVKVLQENKKLDEDKPLQKKPEKKPDGYLDGYMSSCPTANLIPSCVRFHLKRKHNNIPL